MSLWTEEVVRRLERDQGMTEDDAMSLYHALSERYGWTGTIFTVRDVTVVVHEDEDEDSDGEWTDFYQAEDRLTPAIRDALSWHRMWRRVIPEALTEHGNEYTPVINIYKSGEFDIENPFDSSRQRHRADGSMIE